MSVFFNSNNAHTQTPRQWDKGSSSARADARSITFFNLGQIKKSIDKLPSPILNAIEEYYKYSLYPE